MEAYFAWVHEQDPAYILSEKTREGLKCSLNQEKYLKVFLEDGSIPIDNGAAVPGKNQSLEELESFMPWAHYIQQEFGVKDSDAYVNTYFD